MSEIESKDYKEIYQLFAEANTETQKVFFAKRFLEKAKKDIQVADQKTKLVVGYRMLSIAYTNEYVLAYSDSIIRLTSSAPNKYYPAIAYEKKGDFFYQKRGYQRALDNYLQFFEYAEKFDQKDMISRAKYNLGIVQRRTGNIEEAIKLYRENFVYSQENKNEINAIAYLNSISALSNIYNDIKNVDSASYYNQFGHKEATRLQKESYKNHFAFNEGITNYHKKMYQVALDSILKHTHYFETVNDDDKLIFCYYYTGEVFREIDQEEKAIQYYKKVDSIFQKTQSIFPITRKAYVQLDAYYDEKKDLKNQLTYKNQLLKVDSILRAQESYLNKAIFKDYDIPKLQAEKENLQSQKQKQKAQYNVAIIVLFVILVFVLIGFTIQYRKRKTYQQRFQEVINSPKPSKSTQKRDIGAQKIAIPNEIIEDILQNLEDFENKLEFISNTITLNNLAKKINTNPNYLSKVVNHYKKCSFSNYINNLRIEYAIEQLKTNQIFLKYTVKAIAAEVGFNNVQSFSKAFFNAKGINPSYFIRQLKKAKNE
ncbi:AraC family transcriptional regulator [Kordia sp. SMS9]|uniref:AraC family transcriptional regulator n=1 Tax=Kordia sp. SMS9 TaxID=2282170 RepID=UPI0013B3B3A5|nr:AraC family transcriptional regulator [Kordia sp. SMS9]